MFKFGRRLAGVQTWGGPAGLKFAAGCKEDSIHASVLSSNTFETFEPAIQVEQKNDRFNGRSAKSANLCLGSHRYLFFTLATGHSWIDRNARRPAFCSLDPTTPNTTDDAVKTDSCPIVPSSRQSDDTRTSRATRHRPGKRVPSPPPTLAANCLIGAVLATKDRSEHDSHEPTRPTPIRTFNLATDVAREILPWRLEFRIRGEGLPQVHPPWLAARHTSQRRQQSWRPPVAPGARVRLSTCLLGAPSTYRMAKSSPSARLGPSSPSAHPSYPRSLRMAAEAPSRRRPPPTSRVATRPSIQTFTTPSTRRRFRNATPSPRPPSSHTRWSSCSSSRRGPL